MHDIARVFSDALRYTIGLEHLTRWERVAVVTDVEWLKLATNAFRFLMPRKVRVFPTSEAADAKRWIASVPDSST